MLEENSRFIVSCVVFSNPSVEADNVSWVIEGRTYLASQNITHRHWFERLPSGEEWRGKTKYFREGRNGVGGGGGGENSGGGTGGGADNAGEGTGGDSTRTGNSAPSSEEEAQPLPMGGYRIFISLNKNLFSRVITRRFLTLKVRGTQAAAVKRIAVNYHYGPLLECPDLHIVKQGITEYNISCSIYSSPVVPEANITWEFPARSITDANQER